MNTDKCVGVLALTLFGLLSCGREASTTAKMIGVSLQTRASAYYRELEAGLLDEAKAQNYTLIINDSEGDLAKQTAQIENFIGQNVDAIVLVPVDSKGVAPVIKKANEAGIPVFTADIMAHGGSVVSHIVSDNSAGGRLAGEYLAQALNGTGTVAIIGQPGAATTRERVSGFREAIRQSPGVKVVADMTVAGTRDKALSATADILRTHAGLKGIFAADDNSALLALDAVTKAGKNDLVIISIDATPQSIEAIRKGTPLKAAVVQYPRLIGVKTIQQIRLFFDGGQVERLVPVEVGIVDKQTREQP